MNESDCLQRVVAYINLSNLFFTIRGPWQRQHTPTLMVGLSHSKNELDSPVFHKYTAMELVKREIAPHYASGNAVFTINRERMGPGHVSHDNSLYLVY